MTNMKKYLFNLVIIFYFFIPNFISQTVNGQDSQFFLAKGIDESNNKNYNVGLYYFNQALKIDSTNLEIYLERGHTYFLMGNFKQALANINFVIKKEPKNPKAFFELGSIYYDEDKYKAIEYYSKVIEYSILRGDKRYAGAGYFMRSGLKKSIGDTDGSYNDLKTGAEYGDPACKACLEIYNNIVK